MRKTALILAALTSNILLTAPAAAAPADDATAFITGVIDKFNAGDAKSFIAAHEDNAVIIDEFGRHFWTGTGTAKQWLDDYTKMSATEGVTAPRLDYGKPLQATSDGATAYVVLPTTYHYAQKGTKMIEPGSMTVVLKRDGQQWKIASWAYAGGAAAPEKQGGK